MGITLTWHLLVMIVLSVLLIIGMIKEYEDYSFALFGFLLVVLWAVYGGIVYW